MPRNIAHSPGQSPPHTPNFGQGQEHAPAPNVMPIQDAQKDMVYLQ